MRSELENPQAPVDGDQKDEAGLSAEGASKPEPQVDDLRRRAGQATWWIYHECGDPAALELFEEIKKPHDGLLKVGERLESALPAWCEADENRAKLRALFKAQFKFQPETAQVAVNEIKLRIESCCLDFATTKYGNDEEACAFGRTLGVVAWAMLDIPQRSQARGALAILQARERAQEELKQRRGRLEALYLETESSELRDGLAREIAVVNKAEGNDPILELLHKFFLLRNGYWRQFFDKRDNPRRKKRPNFPSMRERLVQNLQAPETMGLPSNAKTITRRNALELAAICMKVAYPGTFPKTLDGESVRLAMQYHEARENR
jgi:hypothetical protein